jgi:hypothetical protein
MNPNTAAFPTNIATDTTLPIANDDAFSNLSIALTSSSGTAAFSTPSAFINLPCYISLDNEILLATATSGTGGFVVSRGQLGTTPATHAQNTIGYGYLFSHLANQWSAEIKAIETSLGINLSNVIGTSGTAGGDLSGNYPNPTVVTVGGASAGDIATAASEAHVQNTDTGTDSDTFQIGINGPLLNDVGVGLEVKDKTNSTYLDFRVKNLVVWGNLSSGTSGALVAGGDLSGNYPNPILGSVGTAGTFGDNGHVAVITVDSKGRIIAASSAEITGSAPGGSAGGDLTGDYPNPTLILVGSAGTYGDTTHIPVFVSDSNGRVVSVTNTLVTFGTAGGDLTGNYPSPSVATVGGQTAVNIASATSAGNQATNINTPSTLVRRDTNGDFAARNITARIVAGGTSGTYSLGVGAGTSGSATITGKDAAGLISITTGSSPNTASPIITVIFGINLPAAPSAIILEPGNAAAAALTTATPFVTSLSSSGWVLESNSVALAALTTYNWYYVVIG